MKKLKIALSLFLAFLLAFTLVACSKCEEHVDADRNAKCDVCGDDVPCQEHDDKDRNGECDVCGAVVEITDDYTLINDGEARFQIVMGTGLAYDARKLISDYISQLEELGITLFAVDDTDKTIEEYEVLIGNVSSRGDDYKYNMYSLGKEGYVIKAVGNKVIVQAGEKDNLVNVIKKFFEDFVGLKNGVDAIDSVVISSDDWLEKPQDDYRITDVLVNDESIREYNIVAEISVADVLETATSLQDKLYDKTGIWLPVVNISDATEDELKAAIIIRSTKEAVGDGNGFLVSVDGKNLVIEGKYLNKLLECTDDFFFSNISQKRGEVNFKSSFTFTKDASKIYYSDFGAKGDGHTDDFAAMKAAHDEANIGGQTVYADSGKTYYIGETNGQTITIKTNVYWGTAKIIIDDSVIPVESASRTKSVFYIAPQYSSTKLTEQEISALLDENGGISRDVTKLNYAPGYKAMLVVYNNKHYQYIRYGINSSSGSEQHELVLIDENGNIDPSTPFLFDYETVTSVIVYRIDDEPITIQGGTIETRANRADSYYNYYSRNINIHRSNVTIKGLRHEITGEGDTGAPYSGFITLSNANNLLVENCQLSGHKTYVSKDPNQPSSMGTYDIGGNNANGLYFKNTIQINFFAEDGVTPNPSSKYWGIMGTNYCKNITYDGCRLSRLDAHAGVYNATIINSEVMYIHLVGGGTALIKDSTSYNYNPVVNLRGDYGAPWDGDVIIDNLKIKAKATNASNNAVTLISYTWDNHYFGYTVHMPKNIIIKDISVPDVTDPVITLFSDPTVKGNADVYDFTAPRVEVQSIDPIPDIDPATGKQKKDANGKLMYLERAKTETADADGKFENLNQTVLTEKVIFVNFPESYKANFKISSDPFLSTTEKIEYLYMTGDEYTAYLASNK